MFRAAVNLFNEINLKKIQRKNKLLVRYGPLSRKAVS